MALNLKMPEAQDLRPRITVFGIGGAGGNAVNNMIEKNLEGAEFVVANTDAQALQQSKSSRKLQLGVAVTQGLGAGAKPDVGASAAEESLDEVVQNLEGSHMCFITAGMGGGTGTGAAPVIARAAREMGILTVGVVTKPFQFEGSKRMKLAESGIEELQQVVDTLIIIPNQNLFRIANERTTFGEAFMMADDVLYQGVKGVTDLMVRPGLINLDFADVRAVMDEMGKAMMGTGEGEGETRAIDAAEKAIANPLLDEVSLKGAKGVLINITGGYDLTLFELDEAANRIRAEVDPDANIIVGSTLDPDLDGTMRVAVVATGIDAVVGEMAPPRPERRPTQTNPIVLPQNQPAARRASAAPAAVERPVERPVEAPAEAAPAAEAPAKPAPAPIRPEVAQRLAAAQAAEPPARPAAAPARTEPRRVEPAQEEAEPNLFTDDAFEDPAPRASAPAPEQPAAPGFIAPRAVQPGDQFAEEPASAPVAQVQPVAEVEEDKSRFGINSLIHRMTGAARASGGGAAPRREPQHSAPSASPAASEDDEDMRMEIPAFLRRQAN